MERPENPLEKSHTQCIETTKPVRWEIDRNVFQDRVFESGVDYFLANISRSFDGTEAKQSKEGDHRDCRHQYILSGE